MIQVVVRVPAGSVAAAVRLPCTLWATCARTLSAWAGLRRSVTRPSPAATPATGSRVRRCVCPACTAVRAPS